MRWEPGAPKRLQQAALALFAARGFEQTTAAEIAQSVGLTERTFFRHFSDKREVLFYGQELLVRTFVAGVESAPTGATPMELVEAALRAAADFFTDEHRPHSRTRQMVVDQNPALQERELHKLATLGTTLAGALRARGVDPAAAEVAAQTGMTVFGIAFARWIREGEERSIADIETAVLDELRALVTTT